MFAQVHEFCRRQSAEEIERQWRMLVEVERARVISTPLAYVVLAFYLPIWLCLIAYAIDLFADWRATRLLAGLRPGETPRRYLYCLLYAMISEACVALPAMALWQMDDPFARAVTIGLVATSLLQITTVRSIHLPMGIAGIGTFAVVGTLGNAWLWIGQGDLPSLAMTTFVVAVNTYFIAALLRANHHTHAKIAQERQRAEAADRAKSMFLAQMSHELRTPLNAIIGMGAIELKEAASPASTARMATLVRSAQGLSAVLDDILDIAAAQGGNLTLRVRQVQLRQEIDSVADLFRPLAEAKGLALDIAYDDPVPQWVQMDAMRMRQCLSNLLSNALRHTQTGGVSLRVQALANLFAVTVSDSGPGIPPALAARLFEPFQQGPKPEGGVGLGLTISRQLARAMGGDLTLVPQPRGARFRLTFRATPVSQIDPGPDPDGLPVIPPLDFQGARVLVVDDIATNRLVAAGLLRQFNTQPVEATSAEEALALIGIEMPVLVLLDMHMPVTDGAATFRMICQQAVDLRRPRPKVVAMTADAQEDHRQRYLALGLDGYISKPIVPARLGEVLSAFARTAH